MMSLNTAEAVDNVINSEPLRHRQRCCLNTAEAVDNVIGYLIVDATDATKSQYRRSSRQCNLHFKNKKINNNIVSIPPKQ